MSWKTFHDFITGELLRMMFQKAFDVFFRLRNCRLMDDVSAGNGEILEKWLLKTFKSGGYCITHAIHVWQIHQHLIDCYGKCRKLYHTWMLWVMSIQFNWIRLLWNVTADLLLIAKWYLYIDCFITIIIIFSFCILLGCPPNSRITILWCSVSIVDLLDFPTLGFVMEEDEKNGQSFFVGLHFSIILLFSEHFVLLALLPAYLRAWLLTSGWGLVPRCVHLLELERQFHN